MERYSDEEVMKMLRRGNDADYREIFILFYPLLTAFANKFLKNEALAKDVVQTVFVNLFSGGRGITQSLRSYLFAAVRNESINAMKKERTLRRHEEQYSSESGDAIHIQSAIEQAEAEERIYRAIQNLPPKCRRIFIMNRFEGSKNQEIAASLGLSVRTVETQISKAIRLLRKSLFNLIVLIG